jgi:predicted Fe-S protein YdhL (DUF1289 family)
MNMLEQYSGVVDESALISLCQSQHSAAEIRYQEREVRTTSTTPSLCNLCTSQRVRSAYGCSNTIWSETLVLVGICECVGIAWKVFVRKEQYQDFEHNTWRQRLEIAQRRGEPLLPLHWLCNNAVKEVSTWEVTSGQNRRHIWATSIQSERFHKDRQASMQSQHVDNKGAHERVKHKSTRPP